MGLLNNFDLEELMEIAEERRAAERERLMELSEKELLVEIALKLDEVISNQ